MCILLSMVLNAAYMLWCMYVSIILWSVLHKQTPLRFGASDFGETPVWGMKFSWNSGSFVLRWSGVKFWYIRMKLTLEPEHHFKTSNQYDTDGIAGPKRRKCRRHIWSWVMCCDFFFTFMDRIFVNGSKTPRIRIVMPGSYIWVNYNDLTATSVESWLIREIIPKWP